MVKKLKIVIAVYYWPPTSDSGVFRWLSIANHWVNYNVDLTIITSKNPKILNKDLSLLNKVDKRIKVEHVKGWEPSANNSKNNINDVFYKKNIFNKMKLWVRANLFIPDAKVIWSKNVLRKFEKFHKKNKYDILITSGPPHSIHLAGLKCKKTFGLKWIADFRDPWTNFYINKSLPLNEKSIEKHKQLEKKVIDEANHVVVTSPSLKNNFKKTTKNVSMFTNGYEKKIISTKRNLNNLVYTGVFSYQQNPVLLWESIKELSIENPTFKNNFKLEFYGSSSKLINDIISKNGIEDYVSILGHKEKNHIDNIIKNAKALLLLGINMRNSNDVIHGKLYDYMAAKKPILAIGPKESDTEQIIKDYNLGVYISFDNKFLIKKTLFKWFTKNEILYNPSNIEEFNRKNIAKSYLKKLCSLK